MSGIDIEDALRLALEALVAVEQTDTPYLSTVLGAIEACSEALAQKDEQEPVAWVDVKDTHQGPYDFHGIDYMPEGKHLLYTAPPKRQPLTEEDALNIVETAGTHYNAVRLTEAAHGIGADYERR